MVSRVRRSIIGTAVTLTAAMVSAGCAAHGAAPGARSATSSSTRPAASAASAPASATSATAGAAGCDRTAWQNAPLTITHQVSAPPVPVLAAIRTAQHPECGYDRLVLDISGSIPSYSVRYVDHVVTDAAGMPVALPGRHYLLITLREAQAHSAAGTTTISTGVQLPSYPALRSWALVGDSEGVVTIAVGLAAQATIRAGELPGHLYIDFKE